MSHTWRWYHTQIWLYGHWLPGDERGFRSRDHRIHSGGDYKHRPLKGEHAGLNRHAQSLLKQPPITLTMAQRQLTGEKIIRWFTIKSVRLAAVSVGGAHTHLLCMLPAKEEDATVGKIKRYVSLEAGRADAGLPSHLFAAYGEPRPVKDFEHFRSCHQYVTVKHAEEGAWVWGVTMEELVKLWG